MLFYLAALAIFVIVLLTISSRVRKTASAAFETETIETDEFVIVKPQGFINPINDKSKFAFEAYSKEFGKGETENTRQAEITVSVFSKKDFKPNETVENETAYNFYKIIESEKHQKAYELKISVLKDFLADYQKRVDETLESFRLK
jgi:hypothetical protein